MSKKWLLLLYFGNLAIIIFFWVHNSFSLIKFGGDSALLAFARLCGLSGAFSILTQYTLISNAPWVNRILGQYKLTNAHIINGKVAFMLIAMHISMIFLVYHHPLKLRFTWLALTAFIILIFTVAAGMLRNRLPYKIWHSVHLLNYTVIGLVIWHQLLNGGDLLVSQTFRYYWITLNVLAFANLTYFRVIKHFLPQSSSTPAP